MGANVKFKASVFSSLFSDPDVLRELYSALEGVSLPDDVTVTINTLQSVLFVDMMNDISFEIGGKLVVLIEHQSTVNLNMCLRLLMYIGRVYEKVVGGENIYKKGLIKIPRPEFFVLYNGAEAYPDDKILRLSDAFEDAGLLLPDGAEMKNLELVVRVININQGRNKGIAERCRTLAEYSAFVGKVREYGQESDKREEAMEKAVRYCLEHDILREFLKRHATEVMNMLITEWNWDDALAVRYEEGREDERKESMEKVARNALAEGASIEFVKKITGLDIEAIKAIQTGQ